MQTVLITGANGSLALPAVDYFLSQYSSYSLILAVRDDSENDPNTTNLKNTIAKYPNAQCCVRKLDLSSLPAVRTFAQELHASIAHGVIPQLAAIICNAMTWSLSSGMQFSADGYEQSIAVNHLAQFSLTLQLLGDFEPQDGRIVFLSSESHWPGKAGFEVHPPIMPGDLELLVKPQPDKAGEEVGRGFQRYGLSKLAVVMTMYELQRRLKKSKDLDGIRVLAVDPGGLLDSRAFYGAHVPRGWQVLLTVVGRLQPVLKYIKPTLRKTPDAAKDIVELAVGQEFAGQEGHFEMRKKADSSPDSKDERAQRALWDKSVEWCKLKQEDTVVPL